jgi:hypothetical protein
MIYIDEWAHGKWSAFGMLNIEAIIGLIGMMLFLTVFVSVNRMRPAVAVST